MPYNSTIQRKMKACTGKGVAKDFPGCGEDRYPHRYGLCSECFREWIFTTGEGQEVLNRATLKATKARRENQEQLKKLKQQKANRRVLQSLLINVRKVCHDYIKERDKGLPCVSCGEPWSPEFQAGHYYKAELYSGLKFDEFNISGQCVGCNIRKDGNPNQYAQNLPNRIGKDEFERLEEKATVYRQSDFKWDIEELKEIRTYYRNKLKELKEQAA